MQRLPDFLVDKIAAGEVVEDPASVVKELVENSLDAGASRITVEIEGGGLRLIRVSDNGHGMGAEEAEIALERYATSKIFSLEDLACIRTLGFRGEALPSIAAVSRFSLETRVADDALGTLIEIDEKGRRIMPCATAVGTKVTARDLFYNTPARLKFQKGERARISAIRDVIVRLALAWPDTHFVLLLDGKRALDLPPCSRFLDRVGQIFGEEKGLFEFQREGKGLRLSAVLGSPALSRPDPGRVVLVVGKRPVQDLGLRRAVVSAFSPLVEEGRFPLAVLHLDLDPADVDVNVHPRKAEVRFRQPREVYNFVYEAVRQEVAKAPWIVVAQPPLKPQAQSLREPPSIFVPVAQEVPLFEQRPQGKFSGLRYVGQVQKTILVCEGDGVLVLIDQHAAHERVQFERLWSQVRSGKVAVSPLLLPEIVPLSQSEISGIANTLETLAAVGFDAEEYFGAAIIVRATPAILQDKAAGLTVRDCIAALSDTSPRDGLERVRKIVATVACHSAVRAGDPMGEEEVRALLREMDNVDLSAYCPHGRQAVVTYPLDTVLRWFGR